MKRTGFRDVVVWNPWIAKSKTMEDFAPEEYKEMVCVEAGSVAEPVTLEVGLSNLAVDCVWPCR